MATPRKNTETDSGDPSEALASSVTELQTGCSHCGTLFEVSTDVLTSADTRVRCGECYGIFDALSNLVDVNDAPEELVQLAESHKPMFTPAGVVLDATSKSDADDLSDEAMPDVVDDDSNFVDLPELVVDSTLAGPGTSVRVLDDAPEALDDTSADADLEDQHDLSAADDDTANQTFRASTLNSAGAAALAGLAHKASFPDQTIADADLFSGDAGLPEVALFDQTRDNGTLDLSEFADADESFNQTLNVHDLTVGEPDFMAASTALHGDARPAETEQSDAAEKGADDNKDSATDTMMGGAKDMKINAPVNAARKQSGLDFHYRERDDEQSAEARLKRRRQRESALSKNHKPAPVETPSIDEDVGNNAAQRLRAAQNELASGAAETSSVAGGKGGSAWPMRLGLGALAALLLGSLFLYREMDRLAQNPLVRPLYGVVCAVGTCVLPPREDFNQIRVLSRKVYSHPDIENALVIEVAMRNEAGFEQRYPDLEVRLSDVRGELVAQRSFPPADYIANHAQGALFGVGKRLDISLEVADPGSEAASFELEFH